MLKELILVSKHPTAQLQSEYARGLCSAGAGLAVALHLELCRRCARASELAGEATSPEARRKERPRRRSGRLPKILSKKRLGPWVGPVGGVRRAVVRGVSSLGETVHLLEAPSGLPLAIPEGAEIIMVLDGAIEDGPTRYLRGDFLDLTADRLAAPVCGAPSGCLCLVVSAEAPGEEEPASPD